MRQVDKNLPGGSLIKRGDVYLGVAAGLSLVGATVLGFAATRSGPGAALASSGPSPLPVATLTVQAQPSYQARRLFVGRVEAARGSAVGFELGGLVQTVRVDEGDRVQAGQLLARLDTARLEARRRELSAALEEAEANRALARITVNRLAGVVEAGGVSRQGLDEAREAYRAARAAVTLARSRIETLEVDLAKAELRAPFDAVVTHRHVDEGRVLAAGAPVLTLQEHAHPEVRVGIAGRLADTVSVGHRYPVQVRDKSVSGRVKAVLPVRGAGTRTVDVIFALEETGFDERPGDLARLTLSESVQQAGYWLPTGALAEGSRGLWSVYVLEPVTERRLRGDPSSATHRVVPYLVEILHQESDRVFVRGALRPDSQVVADGLHRVVPGQLVRLPASKVPQVAERESRHAIR